MPDEAENQRITRKETRELLAFLPSFSQPGRKFVKAWRGTESTAQPYPEYEPDVYTFFSLAGRSGWIDTAYHPQKAAQMLEDAAAIEKATLDEVRTMFTYCVRSERFNDGHWDSLLRSGKVQQILARLQSLLDDLPDE